MGSHVLAQLSRYYRAFFRAWRKLPPRDDAELHAWCYRQLVLLWDRPSPIGATLGRFLTDSPEGKSGIGALAARFPPAVFLVFLGWPLVAGVLSHQRGLAVWWNNWKVAMARPDLFLAVGRGPYAAADVEQTLSSLLHIVVGIYQYNNEPSPGFTIDDKTTFYQLCTEYGLSTVPLVDPPDVVPEREYIAKPPRSTQGRDIFKVKGADVPARVDPRTHFLQPLLKNSATMARVSGPDAGLCTLRVNTLGAKAGAPRAFGACLRLARAGSIIDNFHAGGVACPVDLKTGTVKAGAIEANKRAHWGERMSVRAHPDTGVVFADELIVPYFEEAKELCERAHRFIDPALLCCSWDVALTADGPVLVEAGSCLGGGVEMQHRPDARLYLDTLRERVLAMLARAEGSWRRGARMTEVELMLTPIPC